jgi:CheY-like chemotaxis protein
MADAVHPRPRVLVFGQDPAGDAASTDLLDAKANVEMAGSVDDALRALRNGDYDGVYTPAGDFLALERGLVGEQSALVLNTIGEGVCVVDADQQIHWCNQRLRAFVPEVVEHVRRLCRQALSVFAHQSGPGATEAAPRRKKYTFQHEDRYYEIICSPVPNGDAQAQQVVAVVWDATSGKRLQSKIDAIDAAGRELARIESDAVQRLAPADRLKLMQDKIIRFSKDLMHFDHFAIRLLDRRTNKLEVVIAEGLPPEALEIDLYAQPEGNGISGYVAATGRSYICHDTEKDPRYVLGLQHSKSSLTVPLMLFDEVIGVYNVESERVGAFNEDDRQFAEIFGRYVAMGLNILDLLVVERCATSGAITDNVVHEISEPLDRIADETRGLMDAYIGDDQMRQRLEAMLEHVDRARKAMQNVAAGPNAIVGDTAGSNPDPADPLLNGKRVLIADDEPNIRRTLREVLRKRGCTVTTAKDGYEACALLEQQPFDLVLSDIRMPYRNGYEIFAAAQRAHEGLPVLLMTGFGYDPHHSIVRASQEGLSSVLFKPFKVDQLLDDVRAALAGAGEPAGA